MISILSNTPIPRPNPLTTPNGIWIQSTVLPQYALRTDSPTEWLTDRPIDRWARRQVCTTTCLRSIDCTATWLIILNEMFKQYWLQREGQSSALASAMKWLNATAKSWLVCGRLSLVRNDEVTWCTVQVGHRSQSSLSRHQQPVDSPYITVTHHSPNKVMVDIRFHPGAQLTMSTFSLYRSVKSGWNLGCFVYCVLSPLRNTHDEP